MNHQGHGLALHHRIFRHPHEVTFPTTTHEREIQHEGHVSPLYPEGMGETYERVDFENGPPDGWNPTLVCHEGFFTDVPGFENLAEGYSAKFLGSLALARQGRAFYWGFSIDPERMTAPAADTLANVLHFMNRQRESRTVPFVCATRRVLRTYLELNRESGYLRGIQEHFLGCVLEESRKDYEPTPEGLERWLAENEGFVYSGKGPRHTGERYRTIFEVDQEAKELGTPSIERASLERWLAMLGGEEHERATAELLLRRYVHPDLAPPEAATAADWAAWDREFRDRIVFVQSAGYWWMLDPTLD